LRETTSRIAIEARRARVQWVKSQAQDPVGLPLQPVRPRGARRGLARRAVVLAEGETHLNLLPHVRASWTLRGLRPQIPTPGKNRQVTVFGAIEVTAGSWAYRLGRRCAADFIASCGCWPRRSPRVPVIVVICDNDSIHHARAVTRYLERHPRLELLYGARYSPHDNPVEMSLPQCDFRRVSFAWLSGSLF